MKKDGGVDGSAGCSRYSDDVDSSMMVGGGVG